MAPKSSPSPLDERAPRSDASGACARPVGEVAGLRAASDATIYRHVFESASCEVGGVLVGRMAADGGLPLVTGAIPAINADQQRTTLTFTQGAWAHVHRVLEGEFPPDEQIVGWYHSHPGYGVVPSSHDLFIHRNFFSAPSQIAVVVDPHMRMEGAFAWRDGGLTTLFERPTPSGWVAAGFAPTPASDGYTDALPDVALAVPGDRYPWLALAIAGILGVAIGFGIWSLAEGGAGTNARHVAKTAPAGMHRAEPATNPKSNVQVLGQE
jgi:proteasome lid subunit RPN8/RPN11